MTLTSLSLAERIKARRKKLGWTQAALAAITRMSLPQISRYEAGTSEPSIKTVIALAKALQTTPDWLLGFTEIVHSDDLDDLEREAIQLIRSKSPERRPAILEVIRLFN